MKRKPRKAPKPATGFILVETDNPNYQPGNHGEAGNPKKISATYNIGESPISLMHSKGQITTAQMRAGDNFRRLYEMSGGSGACAIDWRKEPVDGGKPFDFISDRRMSAVKDLMQVRDKLGVEGYGLVELVCGRCMFVTSVAQMYRKACSKRYETKVSNNLKACLDVLAVYWGYQRSIVRGQRFTG